MGSQVTGAVNANTGWLALLAGKAGEEREDWRWSQTPWQETLPLEDARRGHVNVSQGRVRLRELVRKFTQPDPHLTDARRSAGPP